MKIKTYLINLEGSTQRLANAKKQLDAAGWSFERYAAYDGRGKDINEFQNYDDRKTKKILGRSMLNSELGCYLSHYGCVEQFLKTDADYLVVLEDDLVISENFSRDLMEVLNYLHSSPEIQWNLINLAAKKNKISKEIFRKNNFSLLHAYYFPIRGLGLVWNRGGAREFLEVAKKPTVPVDILFQNWLIKNGKGLSVWPPFVKPAGLDSDILGTVASEGVKRKQKEGRDFSFVFKKQARIVGNNMLAFLKLWKIF